MFDPTTLHAVAALLVAGFLFGIGFAAGQSAMGQGGRTGAIVAIVLCVILLILLLVGVV